MVFLGIDVSTTATKALLIDETGRVLACGAPEYPFQPPALVERAASRSMVGGDQKPRIRAVLQKTGVKPEEIAAVGLTGQMHGLVLLDGSGNVLRPAILWNDQRTQEQCDEIQPIWKRRIHRTPATWR